MYKINKGLKAESMTNRFKHSNNQRYSFRSHANNYFLPKLNTNFLKKSISYSGAASWNKLPKEFKKDNVSLKKSKSAVIKHIAVNRL